MEAKSFNLKTDIGCKQQDPSQSFFCCGFSFSFLQQLCDSQDISFIVLQFDSTAVNPKENRMDKPKNNILTAFNTLQN